MECVSLMTEVGLPQALPSDPLPETLHFDHQNDDYDDDYNNPILGTFHFDHQNDDDVDDYNNQNLRFLVIPGILNFGHDDGMIMMILRQTFESTTNNREVDLRAFLDALASLDFTLVSKSVSHSFKLGSPKSCN